MEFIGKNRTKQQTLQRHIMLVTKVGGIVKVPQSFIVLILCLILISPALTARAAASAPAKQAAKPAPQAISQPKTKQPPQAIVKKPAPSKENAQLAMNAKLTMPTVVTHTVYQYMPDASQSLGTETKLAEISKEVAGKVFYELKAAGQRHLSSTVAVVAAVPLSDLKRETEFGRLIAEYYLTDLADRGLRVKELRLDKDINILPQTGEFILSRNTGEIANDTPALDYVVASTFTNTRKTLILQGRLISLKTGLIKTSWRYTLPLNRELLALLTTGHQKPFTIAVKGISQ